MEQRITFGEWLPDQPGMAGALQAAYNVYPQQVGYGPIPSLSDYSDATRRTLPGFDILRISWKRESAFGNAVTGGAWLSSARVVRCWVKSRNERNPRR